MSKRLALTLGVEAIVIAALLTIALDQYTHAQTETVEGLNRWGYRGTVAKQRAYDETRIVMAGGTHAFQPGVRVKDTTTEGVRSIVEQWVTHDRGPVTAFNLGLTSLPRAAYASRLQEFRSLDPDVICLYVDLAPATAVPLAPGLMTRWTGYVPSLLPLAAFDRQLGHLLDSPAPASDDVRAVADAVAVAISMAPTVVAIAEPTSDREKRERDRLLAALEPFSRHPRVTVIDLAEGPMVERDGVMRTAIATQIESAISVYLRARTSPR